MTCHNPVIYDYTAPDWIYNNGVGGQFIDIPTTDRPPTQDIPPVFSQTWASAVK